MVSKQTIQNALVRGNLFFANLIDIRIKKERFGACIRECDCNTETCLYYLLDSLQFRIDEDLLDDLTDLLYKELILLIGDSILKMTVIKFGYYDTKPDPQTLTFQFTKSVLSETSFINLDFTSAASNKFIAFKEFQIEPEKAIWFNSTFNQGTIPDSILEAPVNVSSDASRVVVSRDPFIFDTDNFVIKLST